MELTRSNKVRMPNFELLRIVAIILIIGHHLSLYSKVNIENPINIAFMDTLVIGGKLGVILFVIITGYFTVESNYKWKKVIKLEFQILFYSILFLLIFKIFNIEIIGNIGIKEIIKNIFPTIFCKYWFMTNYILLYIFSPYINKLIKNLEKQELEKLLTIFFVIIIIIPTISTSNLGLDNLIYFVFYYMLGAYIRLYKNENSSHVYAKYVLIFYCLAVLISIVVRYLAQYNLKFNDYARYFSNKISSIMLFFIAYNIFMSLKNMKAMRLYTCTLPNIEFNYFAKSYSLEKIINLIASTTLGVYLIHDNTFVRKILWNTYDIIVQKFGEIWLIPISILFIIMVFILCSLIEIFRMKIIENRILSKILKEER